MTTTIVPSRTGTMQPARMIEAQQDLHQRTEHNQIFIDLCLRMMAHSIGVLDFRQLRHDKVKAKTLATLMSLMNTSARNARCYHVSPDMTALIQHAAAGLDDTDIVDFKALAPFPYGLVRFDGGGLRVDDPRGDVMNLDWVLWGDCAFVESADGPDEVLRNDPSVVRDGFVVWEFNDRIDNPDVVSVRNSQEPHGRSIGRAFGRWEVMGSQICESGTRLGPARIETTGWQRASIVADGVNPVPGTNTLRFMHAFWLMLQQPVTETDVARLTGPARKAAKARGYKTTGDVTVVQLHRSARQARAKAAKDPKRHVEWASRWYVNGFWRWQPYGPGRKERKRIWVDGFIKGPVGKPLVQRKHVYAVRR